MTELQNKTYTINISIDDFKRMATSHTLFVDKTSFISTLLGSGYHVTLITRPRRWGKTLKMTMLQCFLKNNNLLSRTSPKFQYLLSLSIYDYVFGFSRRHLFFLKEIECFWLKSSVKLANKLHRSSIFN